MSDSNPFSPEKREKQLKERKEKHERKFKTTIFLKELKSHVEILTFAVESDADIEFLMHSLQVVKGSCADLQNHFNEEEKNE